MTDLRLQALLGDDVRSAGMHSRPSWLRLVPVMIAAAVATAACTSLLATPHAGLPEVVKCLHSACVPGL